jgi:hypothetical protein
MTSDTTDTRAALRELVQALRNRHYVRMPDEVQQAYDGALAVLAASPPADPRNQCDGCQAGQQVRGSFLHYGADGRPTMSCQAERYASPTADPAPTAPEVAAIRWLEDETCDLRCVEWPTPMGDDADVGWNVVQHHMAKPPERVIGIGRTPLEAVADAQRAPDDPERWAQIAASPPADPPAPPQAADSATNLLDYLNNRLYALDPGAAAPAAEQAVPVAPTEAIDKLLSEAMERAVSNGANSVSMPDELVEIAAWLAAAHPTAPAAVPQGWPKARDVRRVGDMGEASLRVLFDSDNDVLVEVWEPGRRSCCIEFCNGGGGGASPKTRMALIALMRAIEDDGEDRRFAAVPAPTSAPATVPQGDLDEARSTLSEVLEFLRDYEDVVDGPDGEPQANGAMALCQEIRETMDRIRKRK